jgi:hypothetical protein
VVNHARPVIINLNPHILIKTSTFYFSTRFQMKASKKPQAKVPPENSEDSGMPMQVIGLTSQQRK